MVERMWESVDRSDTCKLGKVKDMNTLKEESYNNEVEDIK